MGPQRWECVGCGAHQLGTKRPLACNVCGFSVAGQFQMVTPHFPEASGPEMDTKIGEFAKEMGTKVPPMRLSYPLDADLPPTDARPFDIPDPEPNWRAVGDKGCYVDPMPYLPPLHVSVLDAVEAGIELANYWANGGEWEND